MEFTILDVMVMLFFGGVISLGVLAIIFFSVDWSRARRKKVTPLLGVVLPKEDDHA